jgi:diguanylate cyclase (GGDEF)-like protein
MHSQTQTSSKSLAQRNLTSALLGAESNVLAPAVRPQGRLPYHIMDLDAARNALTEADHVIRSQEERIRQLENLALTDELTGLLNRRGFTQALQRELSLARRDKTVGGFLVMVDLDGFKSINDLWGHSAGDDYLQAVAHALLSEVRSSDIVARIGGDEFAILLTRMPIDYGATRIYKLEKSFNSRMMQWRDKTLPLRASFGQCVYTGEEEPESLMMTADMRLYAHKARHQLQTV